MFEYFDNIELFHLDVHIKIIFVKNILFLFFAKIFAVIEKNSTNERRVIMSKKYPSKK